eukprot:COSAG01_NODE_2605_length_7391_cov_6.506583_2_plen_60_part_00
MLLLQEKFQNRKKTCLDPGFRAFFACWMHVRRSIDNVVKTKIIPVIDPNCWELRPCFSP